MQANTGMKTMKMAIRTRTILLPETVLISDSLRENKDAQYIQHARDINQIASICVIYGERDKMEVKQ